MNEFLNNLNVTTTDIITIIITLGTVLGFFAKIGSKFTRMRETLDSHQKEITDLKRQQSLDKDNLNNKVDKLHEEVTGMNNIIKEKLFTIDREVVETSSFLKSTIDFLSRIADNNSKRIDKHDMKFETYDSNINEFYKTYKLEKK